MEAVLQLGSGAAECRREEKRRAAEPNRGEGREGGKEGRKEGKKEGPEKGRKQTRREAPNFLKNLISVWEFGCRISQRWFWGGMQFLRSCHTHALTFNMSPPSL